MIQKEFIFKNLSKYIIHIFVILLYIIYICFFFFFIELLYYNIFNLLNSNNILLINYYNLINYKVNFILVPLYDLSLLNYIIIFKKTYIFEFYSCIKKFIIFNTTFIEIHATWWSRFYNYYYWHLYHNFHIDRFKVISANYYLVNYFHLINWYTLYLYRNIEESLIFWNLMLDIYFILYIIKYIIFIKFFKKKIKLINVPINFFFQLNKFFKKKNLYLLLKNDKKKKL
jgi:hypothetical protein